MKVSLSTLSILATLGGCASGGLSGIGGSSDYSCAAPPGVSCMSVTGISVNAAKNNLPALKNRNADESLKLAKDGDKKDDDKDQPKIVAYNAASPTDRVSPKGMDAPYSGAPLRTPARILRIWMAPFEDTDNDLHDQKYMYVTVNTGRWLLEANEANVQPQFKQVFPLGKRDNADSDSSAAAAAPQGDASGENVAPADKLGAVNKR